MDKSQLLSKFSSEPDQYYVVPLFAEKGFARRACSVCGRFFWSMDTSRTECPDHEQDAFSFIGNPPTTKRTDYTEAWRLIESFFVERDHQSIPRYPVVCRWRDDLYYTIASIVDFQRVAGSQVYFEFPANPLIIPQTCLRFKDIENVGVTGRHFSSFCMVGQHAIPDTGGYWKERCIELDYTLMAEQFGIDPLHITFVEDVWAGGGSFGPSLEYFVDGLELGNAVFTQFQGTLDDFKPLERCIIDMGAGLERFAWITMGTPTAYDCCFGPALAHLIGDIDMDHTRLGTYYTQIARQLDSVNDVSSLRRAAAEAADLDTDTIRHMEKAYMVADHLRTLIFAISDGSLPSNVGGGYNLRMMIRRVAATGMDIHGTMDLLIDYISLTYAEIADSRADIHTILDIELDRYDSSRKRMERAARRIGHNDTPTVSQLITLYESEGITPEYLMECGAISDIPAEFYARLAELKQITRPIPSPRYDLGGIADTTPLYHMEDPHTFEARVIRVFEGIIILDRTSFYPRGGGQEPDHGTIGGLSVTDVQKHGGVILHFVNGTPPKVGDIVHCIINETRRAGITAHHTATHILNVSSRDTLGSWVWQHSAYKEADHGRLDITHHSALDHNQIRAIEQKANDIIQRDLPVTIQYMERGDAERQYGFGIYQGGVVPVKSVRIVSVGDVDTEACGGTHVSRTGEIGRIIVRRAKRIQDGVVRLEFVAGQDVEIRPAQRRTVSPPRYDTPDIQHIMDMMRNDIGGSENIMCGKDACIIYGYDQKFHVKAARRIVSPDGHTTYCGVFCSGEAVRVMVYSGASSSHSAIQLAIDASDMLGGRAAGDYRFAQGGGRHTTRTDEVISYMRQRLRV